MHTLRHQKLKWIETYHESETSNLSLEFWTQIRQDLSRGDFWADRIKRIRKDADKRYNLALQNLPLPAAFREACLALRQKIREKRKVKLRYHLELETLYHLAVIESFSIDYAPRLKQPGYNIMSIVPGGSLSSIPYKYQDIGFDKLRLLNKTDKKWLVEIWGHPNTHTTLHQEYKELWHRYEDCLIEEDNTKWKEIETLLHQKKETS
jgi:hypothetical protein